MIVFVNVVAARAFQHEIFSQQDDELYSGIAERFTAQLDRVDVVGQARIGYVQARVGRLEYVEYGAAHVYDHDFAELVEFLGEQRILVLSEFVQAFEALEQVTELARVRADLALLVRDLRFFFGHDGTQAFVEFGSVC